MKTLSFLASTIAVQCLFATQMAKCDEVRNLAMQKSGLIHVSTDTHGDMVIIPVLNDVSSGTWRPLKMVTPFDVTAGMEISGSATLKALSDRTVKLQVSVKAEKDKFSAAASWEAEAPVTGHGRLDLFISQNALENLTASNGDKEVAFDAANQTFPTLTCVELQFSNKSDGKPVMKLAFPEGPYRVGFVRVTEKAFGSIGAGIVLRISPRSEAGGDISLSDYPTCKWELSFDK